MGANDPLSAETTPQVVGLGWPRTGTLSLCEALEMLSFGPCYHMRTLLQGGDVAWLPWEAAAAEKRNQTRRAELILQAMRGYRSVADVPAVAFWKDLVHAHNIGLLSSSLYFVLPQKSAEDWYNSASVTVLAGWREATNASGAHAQRMSRVVWAQMFDRNRFKLPEEREQLLTAYRNHETEVVQGVPSSALVRWAPADGWAGLCASLRVPERRCPNVAFPWRNRRGNTDDLLDHAGDGLPELAEVTPLRVAGLVLNALLAIFIFAACCGGISRSHVCRCGGGSGETDTGRAYAQ